ncbi:WhiB family transcriptional regulator [Streptomyces sp. TRM49041]|uniref:WhiB family transcriptional regulator n=1 Tax=Streptomyces sp. TRM49041 TaxID=2603216 RepID=UPI0011EF2107|nr:WhiB family transcriptional regulator [Streptomyces sp. TRM49041]
MPSVTTPQTPPTPQTPLTAPAPSAPPAPPQRLDWRASAACAGLPPQVVFARRAAVAEPALRACGRCLVLRRCEETVAPAESWFDGVSAGVLWRNGRPVPLHRGRKGARRTATRGRS